MMRDAKVRFAANSTTVLTMAWWRSFGRSRNPMGAPDGIQRHVNLEVLPVVGRRARLKGLL